MNTSILVQFWYGRLYKHLWLHPVGEEPKTTEKSGFWQRKTPENQWFSEVLVEISGIEPLTS